MSPTYPRRAQGGARGARFALAVPLAAGERLSGLLAVGERPGGRAFGEEDFEFAGALARQTQAALEGARLHRVRLERRGRIAICRSPAGSNRACFPGARRRSRGSRWWRRAGPASRWGGILRLHPARRGAARARGRGRVGQGDPGEPHDGLVHAWLRAMAGTARPTQVLERLNRFLHASTQTSRYVTLFYGELDPRRAASPT